MNFVSQQLDNLAVENFRRYLRIPSVHPDPDLNGCVKFLKDQASDLQLSFEVLQYAPEMPIVLLTWEGLQPQLPSILINGHMDVVPVFEDQWTYPPFAAEMDANGNIYARGAQDMKCHSIQVIEAVRRMKLQGIRLKRTVHLSFMPDEELGGEQGMKLFVKSEKFRSLNVGFGLDEGFALNDDRYLVSNGEKFTWLMHVHCPGQSGHGSTLLDNTPGEKMLHILNKFYELRAEEKKKLDEDPNVSIGDVTTVNLTITTGGVQSNVIPDEFIITFDTRYPPDHDVPTWERTLAAWCEEAGEGVNIEYEFKGAQIPPTNIGDSNKYWVAFKKATNELNITVELQTFSGGTDIRYLREIGIPALDFTPINNTINKAHSHDEYLNKDVFLAGIPIFMKIINEIADLDE